MRKIAVFEIRKNVKSMDYVFSNSQDKRQLLHAISSEGEVCVAPVSCLENVFVHCTYHPEVL